MRPTQQDSHHDRDIWELARTVWTQKKEIGLQRWEIVCTGAVWAVSRYSGACKHIAEYKEKPMRGERRERAMTGEWRYPVLCSCMTRAAGSLHGPCLVQLKMPSGRVIEPQSQPTKYFNDLWFPKFRGLDQLSFMQSIRNSDILKKLNSNLCVWDISQLNLSNDCKL